MKYGIPEKSLRLIIELLKQRKEVKKAFLFGSRAMGNYKRGSDVDIAIVGPEVTAETIQFIKTQLNEELPLPYYFDILHYDTLSNELLKANIDQHGVNLYEEVFESNN